MKKGSMAAEKANKRGALIAIWSFVTVVAVALVLVLVHRVSLPDNVGMQLSSEQTAEVIERNSLLTDYVWLSPSADFPRKGPISIITVHYAGGDLSLEELGKRFAQEDRQLSANYGIDSDGRVGLYVEEGNGAWASGDERNDALAVHIEVANDESGGDWHVSDAAFEKLVELAADICMRNDIPELVFNGSPAGNLTMHSMFDDSTDCPGPYLTEHMEEVAGAVNQRLTELRQSN